jgi:tetratricopeptide (TPR) repeat protein
MSEELSKTDRYNRNTALMNFCASSLTVSGVVLTNWSAFTASFNNLTTLIAAETYLFTGALAGDDKKAAIDAYTKAINLKPDHFEAYFNRGYARSDLDDKKGAIDDYTQSIKFKPDKAEAYYNRGNTRSNLGDKKGAIDDYTQAIKIKPDEAYAYIGRGATRFDLGDKKGAVDDYIQASELFKKQGMEDYPSSVYTLNQIKLISK